MPPAESPVAGYLRNNPAPPLVRNVAAKDTCKDLESTMVEVVTDQENLLPSNIPYCPLPANTYTKAGNMAEEVQIDNMTGPAFSYIPDAYGQVINSEAKVTKHLGRRKVDEDCNLPNNVEDSLHSAASLEMSILETKVVRKFALPRN